MRLEDMEAGLQREEEAVTPFPGRHVRGLPRVIGGQFVVERDDDGLLAREIAIEESDADTRLLRDVPKRRRLVAAGGNQLRSPCRRGGPWPRRPAGSAGRPAPFARLDIFSEHVH